MLLVDKIVNLIVKRPVKGGLICFLLTAFMLLSIALMGMKNIEILPIFQILLAFLVFLPVFFLILAWKKQHEEDFKRAFEEYERMHDPDFIEAQNEHDSEFL